MHNSEVKSDLAKDSVCVFYYVDIEVV